MTDTDYLRNEPTASFDAHLFDHEDVSDAGRDDPEAQTDRPVGSVCSRTTAYGPFYPTNADEVDADLPNHEGGVCTVCAKVAFGDADDPSEVDTDDTEAE